MAAPRRLRSLWAVVPAARRCYQSATDGRATAAGAAARRGVARHGPRHDRGGRPLGRPQASALLSARGTSSASCRPSRATSPELTPSTQALADGLLAGHHSFLSRAITLCESQRRYAASLLSSIPGHRLSGVLHLLDGRLDTVAQNAQAAPVPPILSDHRSQAAALLQHVVLASPLLRERQMFRVGVTGPPGAGKSSLIERLGLLATSKGHKVAVLAIDPSSAQSGGSILGDKTRMEELSRHPEAFVRPTPSRCHGGGIARNSFDATLLCEAAGCNVLMVETVGGGQGDTAVAAIVDALLLVLQPAGGDELQGIKKGIVEVADFIVVNKADGDLLHSARAAVREYQNALQYLRPRTRCWSTPVLACSACTGAGLEELWQQLAEFEGAMRASGELRARRDAQQQQLLWSSVQDELLDRLRRNQDVGLALGEAEESILAGRLAIRAATYRIVDAILQRAQRL
eukprot:SM000034S12770  [mRNA]  locus=s34:590418:592976:- [translate_table: standard]